MFIANSVSAYRYRVNKANPWDTTTSPQGSYN